MWECQHCDEQVEESFEVCWKCGTSRAGDLNPTFQPADDFGPDALESLEQARATPTSTRDHASISGSSDTSSELQAMVAELGCNMKLVGAAQVIGGCLVLMAGLLLLERVGELNLLQGALVIVLATFTLQAGIAFSNVVDSTGDEIGRLMSPLRAVRNLYRAHLIILAVLLAGLCFAVPAWMFR